MKHIMCFDCGGTAVKYNVMTTEGEFLGASNSIATPNSKEEFIKLVEQIIEDANEKIDGISFSMTGFINSKTGHISKKGGGFKYLDDTYFYDLFSHLGLPISIENDGRCFAIAEGAAGAAKGSQDFVCLTIGTGIGAGIVVNGDVLKGYRFCGGEYGISYVSVNGELKTHHSTCSMSALIKMYKKAKRIDLEEKIEGQEIFENENDPVVAGVLATWYRNLAIAIFNLAVTFNPEKILIGGGVSARANLTEKIEEAIIKIDTYNLWKNEFNVVLAPCEYRNDAGIIGAFYNFKKMHQELF